MFYKILLPLLLLTSLSFSNTFVQNVPIADTLTLDTLFWNDIEEAHNIKQMYETKSPEQAVHSFSQKGLSLYDLETATFKSIYLLRRKMDIAVLSRFIYSDKKTNEVLFTSHFMWNQVKSCDTLHSKITTENGYHSYFPKKVLLDAENQVVYSGKSKEWETRDLHVIQEISRVVLISKETTLNLFNRKALDISLISSTQSYNLPLKENSDTVSKFGIQFSFDPFEINNSVDNHSPEHIVLATSFGFRMGNENAQFAITSGYKRTAIDARDIHGENIAEIDSMLINSEADLAEIQKLSNYTFNISAALAMKIVEHNRFKLNGVFEYTHSIQRQYGTMSEIPLKKINEREYTTHGNTFFLGVEPIILLNKHFSLFFKSGLKLSLQPESSIAVYEDREVSLRTSRESYTEFSVAPLHGGVGIVYMF